MLGTFSCLVVTKWIGYIGMVTRMRPARPLCHCRVFTWLWRGQLMNEISLDCAYSRISDHQSDMSFSSTARHEGAKSVWNDVEWTLPCSSCGLLVEFNLSLSLTSSPIKCLSTHFFLVCYSFEGRAEDTKTRSRRMSANWMHLQSKSRKSHN